MTSPSIASPWMSRGIVNIEGCKCFKGGYQLCWVRNQFLGICRYVFRIGKPNNTVQQDCNTESDNCISLSVG